MANSRDFTGKNRKFTGTKGIVTPKGTTAERVGSESGELRFNTTTELMEYYDGTQWKPIDAPPTISTITTSDSVGTSTVLNADGSTLHTITINGSSFGVGLTVKFVGSTGTEYPAGNITRVSGSQITCKTTVSMGTTDDPYDIQVSNPSGLSALLEDAFSFNAPPVFTNASGQLGTVYNGQVISGTTLNAGATDAEGNTITFTIISGSLPGSGLSISSSTGAITGTLAGTPSLGNYPFVVRASTTEGVVERQFSIQVIAVPPVSIDFLVIAGGGGGGSVGGGGGAGGYRTSTQSATAGNTITVTVGDGGGTNPGGKGSNGSNSSISGTGLSTITSAGGGGGGINDTADPANSGGSGGGGGRTSTASTVAGSGNTPSVNPSQGNNGGTASAIAPYGGAGGGGASAVGSNMSPAGISGPGGAGTASSITGSSVFRAGGGGGGGGNGNPNQAAGGVGGGGTGSADGVGVTAGTTNTGGGGGGHSAAGGKGVVILSLPTNRYSSTTTGSPTVTTSGSNTILQFNGSGSYTV
jgi:hypothetical protein